METNTPKDERLFQVHGSYYFALQVPDNSVGISGSRCSYCNKNLAYIDQVCSECSCPLIGPFGVPQVETWKSLTITEKMELVERVYLEDKRGRLGYAGVPFYPVNEEELNTVEELRDWQADSFFEKWGTEPNKVRHNLTV